MHIRNRPIHTQTDFKVQIQVTKDNKDKTRMKKDNNSSFNNTLPFHSPQSPSAGLWMPTLEDEWPAGY